MQNGLADLGTEVITDQDEAVHVSGHPRRGELEQLYGWVKPGIAIPMHGEGGISKLMRDSPRASASNSREGAQRHHGAAPARAG